MPLDTLSNVKLALGVVSPGDDALLTRLQASADSFVQSFCGRTFAGGVFTEDHPGGARVIFLRNYPLTAVTSVKVDAAGEFGPETLLPVSRYVVHAARGVIESREDSFVPALPGWDIGPEHFPNAVRVTYSTATDDIPAAVTEAYSQLIGHWYRQAKTHAATGQLNILQQANGGTIYPWNQSTGFKLPPTVLELLKPFRVPAM